MIDVVKHGVYGAYNNNGINSIAVNGNEVNRCQVKDLEEVTYQLKQLSAETKNYTYSQEDVESIDDKLLKEIREKFDLEKEDVYKLKHSGFDLEQLYIDDYGGYRLSVRSKTGAETLTKDEEDKLQHKIEVIKNGSDNMYLSALTSGNNITINTLYESNFKGSYKKSTLGFKEEEVTNLLRMNGLEQNEQNSWAAKMLLECGMEVNAESVRRLDNIQTAVDSLDEFVENEKRMEDLQGGKPIGDRLLLKDGQIVYDYDGIKTLKEELGQVTEEDIKEVLEEGKDINIKNLKEVMYKNTKQALASRGEGKEDFAVEVINASESSVASGVEEVQSQINQIRTKLTVEAAQKISQKMPIESSKLSYVVEEMLALEANNIEEVLKGATLEVSEENKIAVQEVMDTKVLVMDHFSMAINLEVESEEQITLEQMNGALKAYSENESVAEKRFGETIKVVENQIEKVLQEQGVIVNEETIAAAKSLIMNGLEVTPEQVENVLQMSVKMNVFLEDLTPSMAAKFIKEGLNPYKATVDHVLEWMSRQKISELKGSIAESIVALEEQGLLNESQKETMLGLYRIMQAVDANREEIIGYLYKNNLPLTLAHLQEATKYVASKGKENRVAVKVDDSFGEVSSRSEGRTAKRMIEQGYVASEKIVEVTQSLEQMELSLGDAYEDKLQKINAFLYPFIKEQFKSQLGQFEGMSTLPESFLEKLEYIKRVDAEVVENMRTNNIPLTISNIYWMDKINANPSLYAQFLEERQLLKGELPQRLEELEEMLEMLEAEAKIEKEVAITTGDFSKYSSYKQMEEVTHTQKQLIEREGVYQIPFVVDGQQRLINLYVQKDGKGNLNEANKLKAVISYETRNLGVVTAYLEMEDSHISYSVQGENASATHKLQQNGEHLKQLIESIGYGVYKSEYNVTREEKVANTPVEIVKKGESLFEEVI